MDFDEEDEQEKKEKNFKNMVFQKGAQKEQDKGGKIDT